nr:unnamed protein product [Spirometra erinaceieuropaei]
MERAVDKPKVLFSYIKSRLKYKETVLVLKGENNEDVIENDAKAEHLGRFFVSVFTDETDFNEAELLTGTTDEIIENIDFTEEDVRKELLALKEVLPRVLGTPSLQTRFGDSARYLGPVYNLPVAQELCEVVAFHPRVCEAFAGGAIDTVYRITTERLFEELNQFVCQNRYRLPSSHLRQINRWWESVFTQHMLCLFGEQDIPPYTAELTFSRLGVYGVRIKQFSKLIESIVEMLRPESLSRAAKLMQELLDTEVRRVYEKFAETTVSEEAIGKCIEV